MFENISVTLHKCGFLKVNRLPVRVPFFKRALNIVFIAGCCAVLPCLAQEDAAPLEKGAVTQDIVGGFVVDQSATFLGQSFYRAFVQSWAELDPDERFTITIKERPTARDGSFITVEYRGRPAFTTQISPISRNNIKQLADMAANKVMQTLIRMEIEKTFEHNEDLGSDEL